MRPYTEQELPIMDRIDDGLFAITGHYRNGILLSPIIGRDIAIGCYLVPNQIFITHFQRLGGKHMKCMINGDPFTFDKEQSIQDVLLALELDPKRVIVEYNDTLIKQDDYHSHTVRQDDKLELLEFVGGG